MTTTRTRSGIIAVDLFCGVGGLTHGLVRGGVDVRAGVDIDLACRYPFESNNPAEFIERDVNEIDADEIATLWDGDDRYKLLAGCAPCQPFSTYSRSGRSKKRESDWRLVSSFGRLIKQLQPDLVTMENVPQLEDHEVFQDFLVKLDGYHKKWSVVECSSIGIPQSRKRLVLLASRISAQSLELTSPLFQKAPTVRDIIADLPPIDAGGQDASDPMHAAPNLSPVNLQRIRSSLPGGTWRDWEPSLQAACHQRSTGATYPSVYGRMEWDALAPTITTQCFGYGNGRFGHPEQDRAISLREAAMLQTFPRSYKFVPDGERIRFNKLGRLIGNAVPVRLGEFVAEVFRNHVGATRKSALNS
jgi:DNA (cytosine-5)-methyltransferase 1